MLDYSRELVPGRLTRGREHRVVILTRRLLRDVDVRDRRCLDLGTQ
jgi:hypothetical protein